MELNSRDVEAAKRGDRQAYARLVQRHQRVVASITLAITTDVDASEDAAQEAFIQGWRNIEKLQDPARFSPWICQIARHRAHDLLRRRKKTVEISDAAPDPNPDALDELLDAEQTELIAGALQALPEDAREAMILFYREGQSIAEIAAAIDVGEDVIKKRLSRARERVRGKVEAALGVALVATVPMGDFSVAVLGKLSAAGILGSIRPPWQTFATAAKVAVAGAAVVIVARSPVVRQIIQPKPVVVATKIAPSEIRGTITGVKNAKGTVTLDFENETRTANIERGSFRLQNVPTGKVHMTFALDGLPNPDPQDVTLRPGESLHLNVEVKTVLVPDGLSLEPATLVPATTTSGSYR